MTRVMAITDIPTSNEFLPLLRQHLRLMDPAATINFDSITAVAVVPLLRSGEIVDTLGADTHVAVLAGLVAEVLPFDDRDRAQQRLTLPVSDFLANYSAGDSHIMQEIVKRAVNLLLPSSPINTSER